MEDTITVESGSLQLEGLYTHNSDGRSVVITHPHSLYGGDMYNSVVYMIHQTYLNAGYSTLRFNFRGVGKSEGEYNEGIGEQDDLEAAVDFLKLKGFSKIDLAGYSFGSWVGASLASRKELFRQVILVSPPVSFMDFSTISGISSLTLAVVGDRDEFADLGTLQTKMPEMNSSARLEVLSNTDHFYTGNLEKLSTKLASALDQT